MPAPKEQKKRGVPTHFGTRHPCTIARVTMSGARSSLRGRSTLQYGRLCTYPPKQSGGKRRTSKHINRPSVPTTKVHSNVLRPARSNNATPASIRLTCCWERLQALTLPSTSLKTAVAFCTSVLDIHCPFHAPHIDLYQTVQPSTTTLASHSPPPEPKPLPANIARKRHVSANERPAPSDNINPPLSPRTTTKTPNIPTHHRLAIVVRDHIDLTILPTSPTPASHANAMSRPTRRPHTTTTTITTPSRIQHRRRKLLAFQTDITDLIPNTFMVRPSLGHYLGKLVAAKQASDDVWEMVKNRSHLAITAYYLFGRPRLTNWLLASLLDQDHSHLTTPPLSFEPASHRNFMHQPTRGPRLTTTTTTTTKTTTNPSPLQQLCRIPC